jgi:hypothetical protein
MLAPSGAQKGGRGVKALILSQGFKKIATMKLIIFNDTYFKF